MNLGHLLDRALAQHASRIAVADRTREQTYGELDARTLRLGTALEKLGLRKGDRVASLQFNSIETIEIDVTAARFGYVRTLLNARQDIAAHLHALSDCKARALFYGEEFADDVIRMREMLPHLELYVCIGGKGSIGHDYEELIGTYAASRVPYDVTPTDWHSIYYTSGSTGRPKGVVLNQANWLHLVRNHLTDLFPGATSTDVVMHAAPLSHGSGALVYAHLVRGARHQIIARFDAATVLDDIERARVTTMFLAPTMIMKLLDTDANRKRDLTSLHSVVYGGAPMAADRVAEAMRRWGSVFAQLYGQWEAPQCFTVLNQSQHREALETGALHRLASAGSPITFARVAVMNDSGEILPPDAEGEIVTAGDHLMVGYLDRPQDTAAIRVTSWQRTGDIGRIGHDGLVYLVDRKHDVIITGGSNVYPREIEEILYTHPDVHEAIAFGTPHDVWGETVHALVVPRPNAAIDETMFLDWCRARLPADKRPRSVELVNDLPKSAYGKILRREIRSRYWEHQSRRI